MAWTRIFASVFVLFGLLACGQEEHMASDPVALSPRDRISRISVKEAKLSYETFAAANPDYKAGVDALKVNNAHLVRIGTGKYLLAADKVTPTLVAEGQRDSVRAKAKEVTEVWLNKVFLPKKGQLGINGALFIEEALTGKPGLDIPTLLAQASDSLSKLDDIEDGTDISKEILGADRRKPRR